MIIHTEVTQSEPPFDNAATEIAVVLSGFEMPAVPWRLDEMAMDRGGVVLGTWPKEQHAVAAENIQVVAALFAGSVRHDIKQ